MRGIVPKHLVSNFNSFHVQIGQALPIGDLDAGSSPTELELLGRLNHSIGFTLEHLLMIQNAIR